MSTYMLSDFAGWFQNLGERIYNSLIADKNYQLYLVGFKNTIIMAVMAALFGVILGALIALIKYMATINKKWTIPSKICTVYVTIMRGTPVVLQLLIMSLVILASVKNGILIAIITFGLNSAAYVSEIIRNGLESVDRGQLEAGSSLGFGLGKTMWYIVIPQAIRRCIPPIGNELVALIKETSIVGYVGIVDLTLAAQKVTSNAMEVFIPLVFVGLIYLVLVVFLTWGLKKLERRLAKSDRN